MDDADIEVAEEGTVTRPEFQRYAAPIVEALKELGGSGPAKAITNTVVARLGISGEEQAARTTNGQSRVRNQIAWARFYLVKARCIDGSTRGIWRLTERGYSLSLDAESIYALFRDVQKDASRGTTTEVEPVGAECTDIYEEPPIAKYTLAEACADLFLPPSDIESALALLRRKKNVVLQGPPGVGKTFVAMRLAHLLLGEKEPERVHFVQFHQSYGYEDFVRGFRPTESGGFVRKDGAFVRLCTKARQDPDDDYVMIIDEINRGNLSKILGDLMMLIEADKRAERWASSLSYSSETEVDFYVPPNVHIIGTMNTADRSLSLVDYALRRRFAFVTLPPGFASVAFSEHLAKCGVPQALSDKIRTRVGALNEDIRKDRQLGEGFCIGHSYFCEQPAGDADAWFRQVIETEIQPLLEEYWFDARDRADEAVRGLLDG